MSQAKCVQEPEAQEGTAVVWASCTALSPKWGRGEVAIPKDKTKKEANITKDTCCERDSMQFGMALDLS